jgi:hypothetical protein
MTVRARAENEGMHLYNERNGRRVRKYVVVPSCSLSVSRGKEDAAMKPTWRNRFRLLMSMVLLASLGYMLAWQARPTEASTTIVYVDPDAPGPTHDGTSWNNAFTNLKTTMDSE